MIQDVKEGVTLRDKVRNDDYKEACANEFEDVPISSDSRNSQGEIRMKSKPMFPSYSICTNAFRHNAPRAMQHKPVHGR
jgi:hypothetical protein